MKPKFLIREWNRTGDVSEYSMEFIIGFHRLLKRLDVAKQHGEKIAVYELGECLIDWS